MPSSATAYATAADMVLYHDVRRLGDLLADDDVRLAPAGVAASPVLAKFLMRRSGDVEMACQVGGKYTPDDLNALTGVAKDALIGLVCDLANWDCEKRRGRGIRPEDVPGAAEALTVLELLKEGERVFPTDAVLSAQTTEVVEEQGSACAAQQCNGRYGETVGWARRYFGRRGGGCC